MHEIFHRYTGYLKNNKSVQIIAKFTIENNLIHELQRLIEISIIQNQFNDFQFLNSEFVNKKKFHEYYRKNLTQGIAKFDSPRGKGMLCYNLANHYRHLGDDLYSSFSYYIKAKRYEPNYLTKYYWWHEIAGVLFLSNHFAFAEKFYRKSIELDKSQVCIPFTYCLLADCLFQNTKFSEASKFYEQYFDEVLGMNKKIMLYFGFKQSLCNTMIEKGYENTVIQNRESVNIFHKAREKNSEELYYKSIELHPLMYLAWNDLGSMYFSQRKFNEAFDAFFIAALIIQTDEDIWMDCLLSAIFTISDELAESIFLVMVQLFGVEILNKITIMVNERLRFSITDTIATLKLFSAMADSFKKFSRDIYMPPAEEYRIYL